MLGEAAAIGDEQMGSHVLVIIPTPLFLTDKVIFPIAVEVSYMQVSIVPFERVPLRKIMLGEVAAIGDEQIGSQVLVIIPTPLFLTDKVIFSIAVEVSYMQVSIVPFERVPLRKIMLGEVAQGEVVAIRFFILTSPASRGFSRRPPFAAGVASQMPSPIEITLDEVFPG